MPAFVTYPTRVPAASPTTSSIQIRSLGVNRTGSFMCDLPVSRVVWRCALSIITAGTPIATQRQVTLQQGKGPTRLIKVPRETRSLMEICDMARRTVNRKEKRAEHEAYERRKEDEEEGEEEEEEEDEDEEGDEDEESEGEGEGEAEAGDEDEDEAGDEDEEEE